MTKELYICEDSNNCPIYLDTRTHRCPHSKPHQFMKAECNVECTANKKRPICKKCDKYGRILPEPKTVSTIAEKERLVRRLNIKCRSNSD